MINVISFFIFIAYYKLVLSMNNIIDVDSAADFLINHLPNSVNIPYNKLINNHKKYLNKDTEYKIVCKKGFQSKRTVAILKVYGYNVSKIEK